jgi:hypothetical protein
MDASFEDRNGSELRLAEHGSSIADQGAGRVGSRSEPDTNNEVGVKQKPLTIQESERVLQAKVGQLEAELQQQRQRIIELERAWKKSIAALTQLQRRDPHDRIDDSTLQRLYNGLVYDVHDWAVNFCRMGSVEIRDDGETLHLLESLSPVYRTYVYNENLRPFLVQSLLMKLIVRYILNFDCENGLLWAGKLQKSLQRIQIDAMPSELS